MKSIARVIGNSFVENNIDFSGNYTGLKVTAIEEYTNEAGEIVRNIAVVYINTNELVFWEALKDVAEYESKRTPKRIAEHLKAVAKEIGEALSEVEKRNTQEESKEAEA